jgi:hypothetical protein
MSNGGREQVGGPKTVERWDGALGSLTRDCAQWRIDWADGVAFYLDTELATCIRHGSIREV